MPLTEWQIAAKNRRWPLWKLRRMLFPQRPCRRCSPFRNRVDQGLLVAERMEQSGLIAGALALRRLKLCEAPVSLGRVARCCLCAPPFGSLGGWLLRTTREDFQETIARHSLD